MVENKLFGEVCDYIRGITYDKEQEQIGSTLGIPVFRSNNIDLETSSLNFDDVKYVDDDVRVSEQQWLKAGDILITAANGSKKHIGKVAFIKRDMPYTFGGFMAVIRSKDAHQLSSQYVFYIMQSHYFRDFLAEQLSATTIQNLNASVIAPMMFPVPPLPEQERIASILGDLDDLIEKQARIIEKKKRFRDGLKTELITGRKRLPGYETKGYIDTGVLEAGHIPDDWELKPISEMFAVNSGSTPDTKIPAYWGGDIIWITPADYKTPDKWISKGHTTITPAGYNSCGTHLVPAGSIIFSKRAPSALLVLLLVRCAQIKGAYVASLVMNVSIYRITITSWTCM